MTIPLDTDAEIRRLFFAEHWKVGTICTQLGVHRDVVERVTGLRSAARVVPAQVPQGLLVPFRDFIGETLTQYPTLRATRLFDMITGRGYVGSVRTLREYVATVRPTPRREVFLRTEPLIGEQAQVDWAYVGLGDVPGGTRGLWIFVMVLAYSRALFVEFVWDLGAASLRRSLVRAHTFFGGSPRQWLFDNPKAIVLGRHGDAVRFHPTVLELAAAFCTQPRLCRVRSPEQKGRVERAVRYVRDRLLAGRTIRDVAQGNTAAESFLREIAPARPHPRLAGRTVGEVYAEERAALLPLPAALPGIEQVLPAVADKTAFVRFDTNLYSVPPAWAERTLTVAADDTTVRVLDAATEVARHARSWGHKQTVEALDHRAALVAQKRGARDLKGRDRLRAEVAGIDVLLARWVESGRNLGSLVGRTVQLVDLYGAAAVSAAVAEAVARGTQDPGALAALCEQQRRAAARPVPVPVALGAHVRDHDVIPHDLGGYDE
jgi:transposase